MTHVLPVGLKRWLPLTLLLLVLLVLLLLVLLVLLLLLLQQEGLVLPRDTKQVHDVGMSGIDEGVCRCACM
jgi:hypothetical protein